MNLRFEKHAAPRLLRGARRFARNERPALLVMIGIPTVAVALVIAMNGNCAELTAGFQFFNSLASEAGRTVLLFFHEATPLAR